MSCPASLADCVTQIIGTTVGGVVSSAWDAVCKSFADAASQLLGAFAKAFVAMPPVAIGSAGVRNVYAISLGLAAVIAALLLLGQVIRTAFTHDGSALAQGLAGVGKAALAFMLTLTVAAAALEAADELTAFIVTQMLGSARVLSGKIRNLVAWTPGLPGSLLLVFAVIGILLTIVLWFEMLLRNAAIAVLVATSPIAAAGQVSEATRAWWPKLAAATTQLIILKPVIALVFCLGFSLTGGATDVETLVTGMLVLLLAAVAWPVIARFFTFASVQVGGGAGLGAVLGFAAGRMNNGGGGAPAGTAPDEFSRVAEARTMAAMEGTPALGGGLAGGAPAGGAAGAGAAAAAGPAGAVAAGLVMAQRAVNSLAGRMEQMAGHAGLQGANPYAQPAGTPRDHASRSPRSQPPPAPEPGRQPDAGATPDSSATAPPQGAPPQGAPPQDVPPVSAPPPQYAPAGDEPVEDAQSAAAPPAVHHEPPGVPAWPGDGVPPGPGYGPQPGSGGTQRGGTEHGGTEDGGSP